MSGENADDGNENGVERNLGPQPLDALLVERGLTNHDIVAAIPEPLTHKAVQRARKGRRLTPQTQRRVLAAVNAAFKARYKPQPKVETEGEEATESAPAAPSGPQVFVLTDLFNYKA